MGIAYTVEVRGISEVLDRLRRTGGQDLAAAAQRGLLRAARRISEDAKERAPYRTGKLRRAIFYAPIEGELAAAVRVPPIDGKPYPFWVHEGTGIYGARGMPITPKNGPFLVFPVHGVAVSKTGKSRRTTRIVRARSVKGTPPNPFLMDAFMANRSLIKVEVAASINEALQGR